jgi:hypothetical protein
MLVVVMSWMAVNDLDALVVKKPAHLDVVRRLIAQLRETVRPPASAPRLVADRDSSVPLPTGTRRLTPAPVRGCMRLAVPGTCCGLAIIAGSYRAGADASVGDGHC